MMIQFKTVLLCVPHTNSLLFCCDISKTLKAKVQILILESYALDQPTFLRLQEEFGEIQSSENAKLRQNQTFVSRSSPNI